MTDRSCDKGCGNLAKFYFNYSKKMYCSANVASCPKTKEDIKTLRSKDPDSYKKAAQKGLTTKRSTVLENGKTIWENTAIKISNTKTRIDETGESIAGRASKKMVETRRKTIDPETGLDQCKLSGQKQKITKDNTFIDGVNMHMIIGKKSAQTKLIRDDNGLNCYDRIRPQLKQKAKENAKQLTIDRLNDIDENGLDHYGRRTLKLLNDIDETGLNAIERAQKKSLKSGVRTEYMGTGIHYQCSFELHFLENLKNKFGLEWVSSNVKNGTYIEYINPISKAKRHYIPDFIINDIVYEIKSKYTWDNYGTDLDTLAINEAKLLAASKHFNTVILVLDKTEIIKYENNIVYKAG